MLTAAQSPMLTAAQPPMEEQFGFIYLLWRNNLALFEGVDEYILKFWYITGDAR